MQEAMDKLNKLGTAAEEVFFFEIDENTDGAANFLSSEESYSEFKEN